MKIFANTKHESLEFEWIEENGQTFLKDKDGEYRYEFLPVGFNRYFLRLNGKSFLVQIQKNNDHYSVNLDGEFFAIQVEDERMRTLRELVSHGAKSSGDTIITAPIPGLVKKIKVTEGQEIKNGDALLILEAMKMENEIRAAHSGIIKQILVEEGSPVEKDSKLIIIEQL